MKKVVVQIQPDRVELDSLALVRGLESFAAESPHVSNHSASSGEDDGRYITVSFSTMERASLWRSLRDQFFLQDGARTPLARAAIVTCEGRHGWDDYLLLHHFDEQEKIDTL